MSGVEELRWVTWGDKAMWHLQFGPPQFGYQLPTLCDRVPEAGTVRRELQSGAPADRCSKCAEVIRYRLGLP